MDPFDERDRIVDPGGVQLPSEFVDRAQVDWECVVNKDSAVPRPHRDSAVVELSACQGLEPRRRIGRRDDGYLKASPVRHLHFLPAPQHASDPDHDVVRTLCEPEHSQKTVLHGEYSPEQTSKESEGQDCNNLPTGAPRADLTVRIEPEPEPKCRRDRQHYEGWRRSG